MKTCNTSLAFILAVLCSAPSALSATLATDGFESPTAPSALNGASGGSGWAAPSWSATGNASIAAKSLSPPIGPAGSLQAVLISGNDGNVMSRAFPAYSGAPLYVGFTMRGENLDSGDFISVQVSDGAVANAADTLGVGIRNLAGNPFYARSGTSTGPGVTTNASQNLTDATDFRVIAKFTQNALEYEIAELFINPADFNEPITPDAVANSAQPGITQLSLLTVRSVGLSGTAAVFIDDLIIADNFATAAGKVPEPTSIAMWALLGLIGGGHACRRLWRKTPRDG